MLYKNFVQILINAAFIFAIFRTAVLQKDISVTAYDSSATLGNGLCYDVVLHVVETAESKSVKFMEVLDIGCFLIGL